MATPITMRNFVELASPGLRSIFQSGLNQLEVRSKRTKLYNVAQSEKQFEEILGIGELGSDDWTEFEQTRRVGYDSPRKGYKTHIEHREFAKGMTVERKELDDNLYKGTSGLPTSITNRPKKLARSAFVQREKAAAEVFNNAFTDSGVTQSGFQIAGPDAVGLCSAAHPYSPEDSSTQSNEDTLALSLTNFDTVRLRMAEFTDDRGSLIMVDGDTLIVPPELEMTALKIQRSELEPGHANNDANVVGARVREVIVWHWLTDANAWWVADQELMKEHLIWFERIPLEFGAEEDFSTFQAKFRAYMRYSRVWSDWRWVYGNNPS